MTVLSYASKKSFINIDVVYVSVCGCLLDIPASNSQWKRVFCSNQTKLLTTLFGDIHHSFTTSLHLSLPIRPAYLHQPLPSFDFVLIFHIFIFYFVFRSIQFFNFVFLHFQVLICHFNCIFSFSFYNSKFKFFVVWTVNFSFKNSNFINSFTLNFTLKMYQFGPLITFSIHCQSSSIYNFHISLPFYKSFEHFSHFSPTLNFQFY